MKLVKVFWFFFSKKNFFPEKQKNFFLERKKQRTFALAVVLASALAGRADAEPAIWVVQSASAKIYLFGTMHILPKRVNWFGPTIAAAFDDSDVLFEEADIGIGNPAAFSRIMNEAVSPDTDLFKLLSAKSADKFRDQVKSCHLPANVVAHFRPWFAAMLPTLCDIIGQSHGDTAGAVGPEGVLGARAKRNGKRMDFFETAEQQIGYLTGASQKVQIAQLEQAIDEGGDDDFGSMEASWESGDVATIAGLVAKSRKDNEDFYRTIFVHRNERFAARIAQLLRGRENIFVAIGAGHLAGPDSVQAQLEKQAIASKRL